MPKKKLSTVRSLTHFTRDEVIHLFKAARDRHRFLGLELRCAPKQGTRGKILIITPRSCGNSVERNLIRRRLKHIFYQERLYERKHSCIVFVKKEAHTLSHDDLKKALLSALSC